MRRMQKNYSGVNNLPPVYDELDFERRSRVQCTPFMRIYHDVNDLEWCARRHNATGRPQAHPL